MSVHNEEEWLTEPTFVPATSSVDPFAETEYHFTCPYCWEWISVLLDLSVPRQSYVEDCEICCNPIEISFSVEGENVVDFTAEVLR